MTQQAWLAFQTVTGSIKTRFAGDNKGREHTVETLLEQHLSRKSKSAMMYQPVAQASSGCMHRNAAQSWAHMAHS